MAEHPILDVSHVPPRKRATIAARAAAAAEAAASAINPSNGTGVTFQFTGSRNSTASHYPTHNDGNSRGRGSGVIRNRHPPPQRRQPVHGRSGAPSARSKGSHCFHCGTKSTPLWRKGPSGPNTLCNACGTRWKRHGTVALRRPISTSTPAAVAAAARFTDSPPTEPPAPTPRVDYAPTVKRKKKTRDEDFDYVGATAANNSDGPAATVRSRVRERRPRCSECGTTSIPKNSDADYPRNESGEILCAGCEEDFGPNNVTSMPLPPNTSSMPISLSAPIPLAPADNRFNHHHTHSHPHPPHHHQHKLPQHQRNHTLPLPPPSQKVVKKAKKIEPRPPAVAMTPIAPLRAYPEPPPLPKRRIVMLPKPPASLPTPESRNPSLLRNQLLHPWKSNYQSRRNYQN